MIIDPGLPLVGYRFIVSIFNGLLKINPVDIHFQEVSGLNVNRSVSMESGAMTLNDSDRSGTLTLTRGLFTAPSPLIGESLLEANFWDTRMLRKDLLVTLIDDNSIPQSAWRVINAYLDSWEWSGVNAENNGVVIESMTFKYATLLYQPIKLTRTG